MHIAVQYYKTDPQRSKVIGFSECLKLIAMSIYSNAVCEVNEFDKSQQYNENQVHAIKLLDGDMKSLSYCIQANKTRIIIDG